MKRLVPVSAGSSRSRSIEVPGFEVAEIWFPADSRIPPHEHARPCFAVMLEGAFHLSIAGKKHDCPPSTVIIEPGGERHGNRMGRSGAHVLAVQPDPERQELFYCCKELLNTVHHFHHGGIRQLATRMVDELAHPDSVTPLFVEGLALEMLAMAARLDSVRVDSVAPPWLLRVRDLLHEKFAERLDNTEIARTAGVHPVHLARTFRKHYRMSIGSYVRGLRLDWAAARLATSNQQISDIALRAGFADQSHFTRHFHSHTGTTPLRYRRAAPHK